MMFIRTYTQDDNGRFSEVTGCEGRTDIIGKYTINEMHWLAASSPRVREYAAYALIEEATECNRSFGPLPVNRVTDIIELLDHQKPQVGPSPIDRRYTNSFNGRN